MTTIYTYIQIYDTYIQIYDMAKETVIYYVLYTHKETRYREEMIKKITIYLSEMVEINRDVRAKVVH